MEYIFKILKRNHIGLVYLLNLCNRLNANFMLETIAFYEIN